MFQIQTRNFALVKFIRAILNAKANARDWSHTNNYRWDWASDHGFINRIKLQCKQWRHLNILSRMFLFKWHIINHITDSIKRNGRFVFFEGGNGWTLHTTIWDIKNPIVITKHRSWWCSVADKPHKEKQSRFFWQKFNNAWDTEVPY